MKFFFFIILVACGTVGTANDIEACHAAAHGFLMASSPTATLSAREMLPGSHLDLGRRLAGCCNDLNTSYVADGCVCATTRPRDPGLRRGRRPGVAVPALELGAPNRSGGGGKQRRRECAGGWAASLGPCGIPCRRGLLKANKISIEWIRPVAFVAILLVGRSRFNIDMRFCVNGGGKPPQIYAIRQALRPQVRWPYQAVAKKEVNRTLVADPRHCEPMSGDQACITVAAVPWRNRSPWLPQEAKIFSVTPPCWAPPPILGPTWDACSSCQGLESIRCHACRYPHTERGLVGSWLSKHPLRVLHAGGLVQRGVWWLTPILGHRPASIAHPRSPLIYSTEPKQPLHQISFRFSNFPSEAGQKKPPPPGNRHRDPYIAGDEKPSNPSVARCELLHQLGRPRYNRRIARSLHPAVLAIGDTSAHRRRALHRPFLGGSPAAPVHGPSCNTTFFEGSLCNMAA